MKGWQQRVVTEREELAVRLAKLSQFIDGPEIAELAGRRRVLLLMQKDTMDEYHRILTERILLFE